MGHAIATQEGLSIEYDEDVCCDVCQSVSTIYIICATQKCFNNQPDNLQHGSFIKKNTTF